MKKVVLIIIILTLLGIMTGGGFAYWQTRNSSSTIAETDTVPKESEGEMSSEQILPQEYHSIEEYKEKFSKDKKYKENCTGEGAIDYSMFDINDINAANQAVACYQLKYDQKRGTKEADTDYFNFRSFYSKFDTVQYKRIYSVDKSIYELMNQNYDKFPQKYYKYGLIIQFDEGDYIICFSNKYLKENFENYVTDPEKEILEFNVQFDERIVSDGRYIIPKSELIKQLEFWGNFKKKYPEYSKENGIDDTIESQKREIARYPIAY